MQCNIKCRFKRRLFFPPLVISIFRFIYSVSRYRTSSQHGNARLASVASNWVVAKYLSSVSPMHHSWLTRRHSLGITMNILVRWSVESTHFIIQGTLEINVQQDDRLGRKGLFKSEAHLVHGIVVLYVNGWVAWTGLVIEIMQLRDIWLTCIHCSQLHLPYW